MVSSTKWRAVSAAVATLGVVAACAMMAHAEPESKPSAAAPVVAAPAGDNDSALGIERLSFLTGTWRGSLAADPATKLEELWTEPAGGNMTGAFRWVTAQGKVLILEILSITQDNAEVKLRLRHFAPSLDEMAKTKAGPLVLTLKSVDGRKAVFAKGQTDASGDLESITYDASADAGATMTITVAFTQPAPDASKPPRKPLVMTMKKAGAEASPAAKPK